MRVIKLAIEGLLLVELDVHSDERGFFVERFNLSRFHEHGLSTAFVQDNHSRSLPGVLRGLHYQYSPAQGKLIGVARGRIWDVTVDIRPHSPTFGKSSCLELNDSNGHMLWIPAGFAHGFCVLGEEPADVLYKVDAAYNPRRERGLLWSDPELAIDWPIENPIVSARDRQLPGFAEYCAHPVEWDSGDALGEELLSQGSS